MAQAAKRIDLDKARAARAEAQGVGPEVKFGGQKFNLPPELPYGVLELIVSVEDLPEAEQGAAVIKAAHLLMGEDAYAKFMAADPPPSVADFEALIEHALEVYGLGENRASRRSSSRSTSRQPKRTSNGSTG
jgi:hypothetical protein